MIDRVRTLRDRFRPPASATAGRRLSRRQREERQRRFVIFGIIASGILVVALLAGGAIYQYLYLPNQSLAAVNGSKISRSAYWKYRKYELINQINQYTQFAQYAQGQNAQQYQQLADQARQELQTVEQDAPVASTLSQMVDDRVILQHLNELGITITPQEMDQYVTEQFSGVSLGSPTPTPPIDPTAAAWATATAQAQASAAAAANATPGATPGATPAANPAAVAATPESAATPAPAAAASPAAGTPEASPSPTVSPGDAEATATANMKSFEHAVLTQAGMSMDDFRSLILKPDLARQKASDSLGLKVAPRQEEIHAEHILVKTQDEANQIEQELKSKPFEEVAKEKSTDTATAPNGGDLGWFPRGVMVPEFDAAAFNLKPGEVSAPVQTQFGWHIIKVLERDPDRPVLPDLLSQLRSQAFQNWIDTEKKASHVEWNISQPMPASNSQNTSNTFSPPVSAPPPPTETPAPAGTPTGGAATPAG
ncbi:MAG TPA: peptidylprolyl isomerase [Thermomicrobiaceae bacterium]|nr:peptidylprolyl isomerase [Thermomicrobiaceae bacterium]